VRPKISLVFLDSTLKIQNDFPFESLLPPEPVGKSAPAQRQAACQGRSVAESAVSLDRLTRCAKVRCRPVEVDAGGLLPLVREAHPCCYSADTIGHSAWVHPGRARSGWCIGNRAAFEVLLDCLKSRCGVSDLYEVPGGAGIGIGQRLSRAFTCPHVREKGQPALAEMVVGRRLHRCQDGLPRFL
jgi:hypothetical protein